MDIATTADDLDDDVEVDWEWVVCGVIVWKLKAGNCRRVCRQLLGIGFRGILWGRKPRDRLDYRRVEVDIDSAII